ncbi:MAG: polysaccharide deacetylase family protein [Candidatus Omnitrophota bacterium]
MKKLVIFLLVPAVLFGSLVIYLNQNYATPILMYHSLDKARVETYAAIDPEVFRQQMEFIKAGGYKVTPFVDYCHLLKMGKPVPRDLVVITFDDGYRDNQKAIAILKEFGYPATIFLIAEEIGKNGFLSKEDIASFLNNAGPGIGSHTLTHAYLPDQGITGMQREILQSKKLLEEYFSQNIELVSYPIGGFNQAVLTAAQAAGYLCGCTTNRGFSREIDPFALRRIKVTNRDLGFRLWAKLSGFYNAFRKPKNPY